MVLATLTSFCVRCPTRERSGFYDDMVGEGGGACQRALSTSRILFFSLSPPLPPPGKKKRIREVGGKQQLDPTLLPLKSVKVCGAAVLHHQHKVLRHRQQ